MTERSAPLGDDRIPPTHSEPTATQIATGAHNGGAAEGDSSKGGIVPPYLDDRWRAMRARLNQAAAHAEAASDASTLEEVAHQTSLAYGELHRADFIRERIEQEERKRENTD